jgi:hypothetical protein
MSAVVDKTLPAYYTPRFEASAALLEAFLNATTGKMDCLHLYGVKDVKNGKVFDMNFGLSVGNGDIWLMDDGHMLVQFYAENQRTNFEESLCDHILQSLFEALDWGIYIITVVES